MSFQNKENEDFQNKENEERHRKMVLGYIYALRQIAEMERKGNVSVMEISERLNLSTQQLKVLLEIMERAGHVEKLAGENNCLASLPTISSSQTSSLCKNCSCGGLCGKVGATSCATIYRVTEKGKKVCRNNTD